MVRPSDSSTVRRSAVTVSAVARTCCVSIVEEFIPRARQSFVMISDNLLDPPEFLRREASATFEADRVEPDLRLAVVAFHMYMGRFIAVTRVEEKTVRSNSQDCGHQCSARCVPSEEASFHVLYQAWGDHPSAVRAGCRRAMIIAGTQHVGVTMVSCDLRAPLPRIIVKYH